MGTVGKRISELLKAMGKSQAWLAREAGYKSQQGIASIVAGDSERPTKLREIAVALGTSQEYLLGETNDPTPFPSENEVFAGYSRLGASEKQAVAALIANLLGSKSAAKPRPSAKRKASPRRS